MVGSAATGTDFVTAPVAGLMATIELAYCGSALQTGAMSWFPAESHAISREARLTATRFVVPAEAGEMVKAREAALEFSEPLETVTKALPGVASAEGGTMAWSAEALVTVVSSAAPFHRTEVPAWKLLPCTLRVTAGEPAAAACGLIETSVGKRIDARPGGEVGCSRWRDEAAIEQVDRAGLDG